MPPSGFNKKAVCGALGFIKGCYEDLLEEVSSGKFSSVEEAIEHELAQIDKALSTIHIDEKGNLVEKEV